MNLTALSTCIDHCIPEPGGAAFAFDARRLSVRAAIDAPRPSLAAILVNRAASLAYVEGRPLASDPPASSALAPLLWKHRIR
jgi:hypothetical protein